MRRRAPSVRYIGLAMVFHGWELAGCEAVEPEASVYSRHRLHLDSVDND